MQVKESFVIIKELKKEHADYLEKVELDDEDTTRDLKKINPKIIKTSEGNDSDGIFDEDPIISY